MEGYARRKLVDKVRLLLRRVHVRLLWLTWLAAVAAWWRLEALIVASKREVALLLLLLLLEALVWIVESLRRMRHWLLSELHSIQYNRM
jgi:hypothetical protein